MAGSAAGDYIFSAYGSERISVAYQDRMAGRMKINVVKMDDRTFGVAINGEVFEVNDGCTMLGEAGSLMRSLNSKIMEAAAKARRARELRQPIGRVNASGKAAAINKR